MARDTESDDLLKVYLNDHLAGSAAAVDLVGRMRQRDEGTPIVSFLTGLGPEIEADKATLEAVMGRLGVPASPVKQLAGKVMEKLSRLRLDEHVTGGAAVTRLMELETLSLGIEGKLSLWRSLQQVAAARPELAEFDLAVLGDRAISQRAGLEPYRLASAAEAFAPPPAA